mgnify:FL=1
MGENKARDMVVSVRGCCLLGFKCELFTWWRLMAIIVLNQCGILLHCSLYFRGNVGASIQI